MSLNHMHHALVQSKISCTYADLWYISIYPTWRPPEQRQYPPAI